MITIVVRAYQCIGCGHIEAPAAQLLQCDACHGFDLHTFEAEQDPAGVEEAPILTHDAATRLLAAIERDAGCRWTLTELGEGACETDLW